MSFLGRSIYTGAYIPTRQPGYLSQYSDKITGLDEDGIRLPTCVGVFVFNIACINAPWPSHLPIRTIVTVNIFREIKLDGA
jgi:hypothetical protein